MAHPHSLKTEYDVAHRHGALAHRETQCHLLARTAEVEAADLPVNIPGHLSGQSFLAHREYVTTLALQISPLLARAQVASILEQTTSLQGEVSVVSIGLVALLPALITAGPLGILSTRSYGSVLIAVWFLLWVGLYVYFVRDLHRTQQRTYEDLLRTLQTHLDAYHLVRQLAEVTRLQC